MLRIFVGFILSLIIYNAVAAEGVKPLPSAKAFNFSAHIEHQDQLILEWHIASGYFLYRDKLKFSLLPQSQVSLGTVTLPQGQPRQDELHGKYQVYTGDLKVVVPLVNATQGLLDIEIGYQGCSSQGFCYTPVKKPIDVDVSKISGSQDLTQKVVMINEVKPSVLSGQNYAQKLSGNGNKLLLILGFFGLGLLLAFTPCVLPMVPILSSIVVGHHKNSRSSKSFLLSVSYVLGMALTYAVAGMVIASLGSSFQVALQKTWVTVLVSTLFVILAFWLLDFYKMHLPAHWQRYIAGWSHRQNGGTYAGVFLMGVVSTLIVSPCVSAPLVGVLAYIAQTGNIVFGGVALLAMGLGMGVPLLLIGISAGKLLPKSGPWMQTIQQIVALLMLGMAIWMLSRVLPGSVILFLWGLLLAFSAVLLGLFAKVTSDWKKISRGLGLIVLTYGLILMIGAIKGNSDPLCPWENWRSYCEAAPVNKSSFIVLTNMEQFDYELTTAAHAKKIVMLDFYADWCTACVVMDKHVLNQPSVQEKLKDVVLLRANVTDNNDFDRAILQRFHVIAPPTILFFDREGKELKNRQIVGEVNAKEFLAHLQQIQN